MKSVLSSKLSSELLYQANMKRFGQASSGANGRLKRASKRASFGCNPFRCSFPSLQKWPLQRATRPVATRPVATDRRNRCNENETSHATSLVAWLVATVTYLVAMVTYLVATVTYSRCNEQCQRPLPRPFGLFRSNGGSFSLQRAPLQRGATAVARLFVFILL